MPVQVNHWRDVTYKFRLHTMAYLWEPCLLGKEPKVKEFSLAKLPLFLSQETSWPRATGRKKWTHPHWSLAEPGLYLHLLSIKETCTIIWETWCFGTVVHHLLGQLAFQIKSLYPCPNTFLVSQLIGLFCGEQYELGLSNNRMKEIGNMIGKTYCLRKYLIYHEDI